MKSESIPVTLEWRSIELNVQTAAGPKAILRGLTGHASPGDLVGIMGPSGAGKTSLLNVLAQRTPGAPGGQVLLNGEPWRENYLSILAYMPQDEMFLAELTPREHLTFMAQLRMHGRETAEQAQRVEQVLREMKLTGVANSLIGAPQADGGLSRNERKRLNFATETLTEPSLLYVDEPTTGLDSVMAKNVVEQLKLMASGSAEHPAKRTVLATIHQPSAEIFKLFDKLYFIVDGRLAYFGPTAAVPAYFSAMGYDMPPTAASVPDFVMELCVDPSHRSAAAVRRKELCEKFMTAEVPAPRSAASDAALAQVDAVAAAPTSTQFGILMARDLLMRRRTPILTKAIIVRNGVLATLLGLLLLRLDMSQTYVYSLTGSIFFGVASCVMPTSIGHISTLPFQLPVVIREVRANSYSVKAYFAAKFLGDIPVDFIGCTLFATLLNFLTGMAHDDPVVWLKCVGIFFCATLIGNAIGQWGAIVAPSDNPFVGLIFVLLLVIPQFLFCGVMILIDQIPVWWRWMAEVSVFRYFLELAMSAQWDNYGNIPCDSMVMPDTGAKVEICPFRTGRQVKEFYSLDRTAGVSLAVIAAWWVAFKCLGLRALEKKCAPPTSAFGGPPPDDATAEEMPAAGDSNVLLEAAPAARDAATGAVVRRANKPLEVSWHGLGLTVSVPDPDGQEPPTDKTVLHGAAGVIAPGELVAVMGASGSGKSVLLRCLGARQTEGKQHGSVAFNGGAWSSALGRHVAFMGQEDHFMAEVTVHEHLLFHAALRMDASINGARREQRVEEVMAALGLTKVRDTLIGLIGHGISGGERRRLSYAAEILQEPSLLFLDEPTSGLDSSMAEMVVKTLRIAADGGTTCVCTIHQPSQAVFEMFDQLILLSEGEVAYFGPAKSAGAHFAGLGFACAKGSSHIDHMMTLVDTTPSVADDGTITTPNATGREAAVAAARHAAGQVAVPEPGAAALGDGGGASAAASPYDSTWREQLGALMAREVAVRKRSKVLTKAVLGRTFVISFLMSTLYANVAKTQQGVFSITGALSFVVINHVFTYTIGQAVSLPIVIPTLRRENAANMYGAGTWYLSKTLADLPFDMLTTLILGSVVYWSIGFTDDVANFGFFFFVLVLVSLLATGFGHMIGTITSILGKPDLAVPITMIFLFPMFLFAGLLINFNNCPDYLLWLQYISIFYYAFGLVSINQWEGYGGIACSAADAAKTATGRCAFSDGNQVLLYFGIRPSEKTRNLIVIITAIVVFRLICAVLLSRSLKTRAVPTVAAPATPKGAGGGDDVAVVVQAAKAQGSA